MRMACDHKGGPELIEMAESSLRSRAVPVNEWPGLRFRWSENLDGGMWASVIVEIERRGDQWIVTRLDRRQDKVDDPGFAAL